MMTCRDAASLLSERLDHGVGLRREWMLRLHLLICKACRRYHMQIHWLHGHLQSNLDIEHPTPLDYAARKRIIDYLCTAQSSGCID